MHKADSDLSEAHLEEIKAIIHDVKFTIEVYFIKNMVKDTLSEVLIVMVSWMEWIHKSLLKYMNP